MKIKRLIDAGIFLNFSGFTRKAIEDELEKLEKQKSSASEKLQFKKPRK